MSSRRRSSPLTRRILAVNILALAILVAGLLYLDRYRDTLIQTKLDALEIEATIFAAALGESAVKVEAGPGQRLVPAIAGKLLRRLVEPTRARARLFGNAGALMADTRSMTGAAGMFQIEMLAPPADEGGLSRLVTRIYDGVLAALPLRGDLPPYREVADQRATDYREVVMALAGDSGRALRGAEAGGMVLSVAVPVQRFKQVVGALMLTKGSRDIEQALRGVRVDILQVFLVALAITVLMSLYLAGTISRPLRRLAAAAERVRRRPGRHHQIPAFTGRGDEIEDLAGALRDMTDALWQRMDEIERFAADVSHEIKNPLTSLRSAVETASRLDDPAQQQRLMAIIVEDVQRLDRLINDISGASRLDAELSRAQTEEVDLGALLAALVEMRGGADGGPAAARIQLEIAGGPALMVAGVEGRLVQVFQNLIDNAVSFSPPGGVITVAATGDDRQVTVTIEDQGPGMPEGKLEAIFDRFYSERPDSEAFGLHSGLGLSISRQIVEAHGGSIQAENRSGPGGVIAGARFVLRLPRN